VPDPANLRCYRQEESEGDRRWEPAPGGPLVRLGDDVFVSAPPEGAGARAYVNGHPVIALHAVRPNDLVLTVSPKGECESWVVAPAGPETGVAAEGRRCALTRSPIGAEGGVLCGGCGGLFQVAVATQLGACPVCKESLDAEKSAFAPPEEIS